MIDVRAAATAEMILAFLQGEIDSLAWIDRYTKALALIRADRSQLIDRGDPTDPQQNADRRGVLGAVPRTDPSRPWPAVGAAISSEQSQLATCYSG
jgi:hypothetical protein